MNKPHMVEGLLVAWLVLLLPLGASAQAERKESASSERAARTADAGLVEARRQAAWKPRRIIWNNDGCDVRLASEARAFLAARMKQVADTQVDSVFYCTGVTGLFEGHLPKVGETRSRGPGAGNIRALLQADHDPLRLVIDSCRQQDLEVFFSLRMNDIHDSFPGRDWLLSDWKRAHPEYLLGQPGDFKRFSAREPRRYWSALNYEHADVRDYVFRILEDVCQRYDVDGIELDWLRHPLYFPPTLDGRAVLPAQRNMINDLMHRIRGMTSRIEQERGRPLLIACPVPLSVEKCLELGLDVETWLREDLVDILIGGHGNAPMAMAPQIRRMAKWVHGFEKPFYVRVNSIGMRRGFTDLIPETHVAPSRAGRDAWRAAATNIWHAGADGVYTFNLFPSQREELLDQLGAPESLEGLSKLYGVDWRGAERIRGYTRAGMVAPDRLPVPLAPSGWTAAKLPVGEDIVANAPPGATTRARLGLRVANLDVHATVNVRLNGTTLETDMPVRPPETWLRLIPDAQLVREGENLVEVSLTAETPREKPATIDRLYLYVEYE